MSVGIYMDEHVPGPITQGLRQRGVDVLTPQEDGRDGRPDAELLDRATMIHRIVFTEDQDFFKEAAQRQRAGLPFSGVFFMTQQKLSYRECIDELELIAQCTSWEEWNSQINSLPIGG
jgi:predicted nuclease of predicted toxin-antitoxin system